MSLIEETKEKKRKLKLGKKIREGKGSCLGVVEEKISLLCWTLPIHHQTSKFLVFLMVYVIQQNLLMKQTNFVLLISTSGESFLRFLHPISLHILFFFSPLETLKQEKASNFLYLINYVQP